MPVTTVSVTCRKDGRAHDVPDAELAAAISDNSGHFMAVCGHLVAAAPMVEPGGKPCALCAEVGDLQQASRRRSRRS